MYKRLLDFLRCPDCGLALELDTFATTDSDLGSEISEGLLHCAQDHWFPVVRGIPRMLPDALGEHWAALKSSLPSEGVSPAVRAVLDGARPGIQPADYDHRTRENFSHEWEYFDVGDRTWGMELDARVREFFVEPLRIPVDELKGLVVLDAGCGNGSQSVAYTELGMEVIAVDISSGVEHGQAFRAHRPGAAPDQVHFVQGDLMAPPLAPECVDVIHSAGVLHHTPDTARTFRRLCSVLRRSGTFYVWVYAYEPVVTPIVNGIRSVTRRVPADTFARLARVLAPAFQAFCFTVDKLGIRSYARLSRREAALALMDIFGAPHAHYHSVPEVTEWFREEGFDEMWECNRSRRGFGVCGRRDS